MINIACQSVSQSVTLLLCQIFQLTTTGLLIGTLKITLKSKNRTKTLSTGVKLYNMDKAKLQKKLQLTRTRGSGIKVFKEVHDLTE